jgi:hypothetical protein
MGRQSKVICLSCMLESRPGHFIRHMDKIPDAGRPYVSVTASGSPSGTDTTTIVTAMAKKLTRVRTSCDVKWWKSTVAKNLYVEEEDSRILSQGCRQIFCSLAR